MDAYQRAAAVIRRTVLNPASKSYAGEALRYRPGGNGGRTIQAIVARQTPEAYGQAAAPVIQVTVLNDPVLGIDSKLLDAGADAIDVAERPGQPLVARRVHTVIEINPGTIKLELR